MGVGPYVARTRVRVLGIGTYLRVGFASSQNLEYGDTDDKYPKFGYGCGGAFDKNKEILYKFIPSYESYLWTNINYIIINGKLILHIKFSFN